MPFIIIGVIAFLIFLYFLVTYNKLVTSRNRVRNQKSQIDVELKRRFDLIPNLVGVVKGCANHEKSILEDLMKARNTYVSVGNNTARALGADNALTGVLSKLFALSESYPELKTNSNFLNLQSELSKTEQKIAFSRQFYNDAVNKFNNRIEMFPSNLVAKIFKFHKEAFFETVESERKNVEFNFMRNCPNCGAACTSNSNRCEYCRSPL